MALIPSGANKLARRIRTGHIESTVWTSTLPAPSGCFQTRLRRPLVRRVSGFDDFQRSSRATRAETCVRAAFLCASPQRGRPFGATPFSEFMQQLMPFGSQQAEWQRVHGKVHRPRGPSLPDGRHKPLRSAERACRGKTSPLCAVARRPSPQSPWTPITRRRRTEIRRNPVAPPAKRLRTPYV